MTRIAIEARDLQLNYRRKPILNHLNLAVPEGAVLGLVGRNGAGKSTLMRCLTGLLKPTQGDCRIGGYPSQDLADACSTSSCRLNLEEVDVASYQISDIDKDCDIS